MTARLEKPALNKQDGESRLVGVGQLLEPRCRHITRLDTATACQVRSTRYRDTGKNSAAEAGSKCRPLQRVVGVGVQTHVNRQRHGSGEGLHPEYFGNRHQEGDACDRDGTRQCAAPPQVDDIDKWTGASPGPARCLVRPALSSHPVACEFNRLLGNEAGQRCVELVEERMTLHFRLLAALARVDNPLVAGCDSCGAPIRIDRDRGLLVCDHCGSQQEAPAVIEHLDVLGETASTCPACSTPLSAARLEGHPLLFCKRCFGMLIDMSLFVAVIDAARALEHRVLRIVPPRRQNPGDRHLDCPSCWQPMINHLYGGPGNVVLDSCESCQVNWLDPGELRRIVMAPDTPHSASKL